MSDDNCESVCRVPFVGGPHDGAACFLSTESAPETLTFNADTADRQAYYQYTYKSTAAGDDHGHFKFDAMLVMNIYGEFVEAKYA